MNIIDRRVALLGCSSEIAPIGNRQLWKTLKCKSVKRSGFDLFEKRCLSSLNCFVFKALHYWNSLYKCEDIAAFLSNQYGPRSYFNSLFVGFQLSFVIFEVISGYCGRFLNRGSLSPKIIWVGDIGSKCVQLLLVTYSASLLFSC